MEFEVLPGTAGLTLARVTHILVPGHGRDAAGTGLTPGGVDRCRTAADLHRRLGRGLIVCSGYKSPVDGKGDPWTGPGAAGETFRGVPEADLMRDRLVAAGIGDSSIRVERHSVDTVTNLLRAEHEGHFGDDRPVAIVAQAGHLRRILAVVAPRTLRRPYLGVVVPGGVPEHPLARPVSRLICAGLPREPALAITTATRRAERLWGLARRLGRRSYH
ncbi:YdcF family protein [Actinoplanes flavus]|uniref:YdcF family protein n=1 Tax=Actinoplanes flavus TaxID=2820290 RepID=A0ABS3UI51_9ACTN|nr:YdcF family protein [Actinoplanes flavus]MBO3738458.1 YdcF family protein [Actinoplanes flavus]